MFSNNSKISYRQIKRLLILDIFSTTSLILPKIATDAANQDGLLSIIMGTFIGIIYACLILSLANKIQGNFIEYSQMVVGRLITYIIAILYGCKIILSCVYIIKMFSEVITMTLLPFMSDKLIIISFLAVCAYAASKGMETRGRIAELLFLIVIIPIIIILLLAIPRVNVNNVMPLFVTSIENISYGGYYVFVTYSAIEFLLFATPYIRHTDKIKRPVINAIITVGLLNLAIFVVTVGLFGVAGTKEMRFPALAIMEVIRFPGGFLGRQDALMITFWIISIYAVLAAGIFYLSVILKQVIKVKEQSYLVIPFVIIIYIIATGSFAQRLDFDMFGRYMTYIGIPQSIIIPVLLLFVAKIRGKGRKV